MTHPTPSGAQPKRRTRKRARYKPSMVRKLLALKNAAPEAEFTDADKFLEWLNEKPSKRAGKEGGHGD